MRNDYLILISIVGVFFCGCVPNERSIAQIDLINPHFEQGSLGWKFYFDESNNKVTPSGGILNSGQVALAVTPLHQLDGLSQQIDPAGATEIQLSAYGRAKGTDIQSTLRIECIDPEMDSEEENYGQLAESESAPCTTDDTWLLMTVTSKIPKGTKVVCVFACVNGKDGEASFDDFVVTRKRD